MIGTSAGKTPVVMIEGKEVKVSPDYQHWSGIIGSKSEATLFVENVDGHSAIGRTCTICRYGLTKQKERRPARGWGIREGDILRGRVIQHIKKEHEELLGKLMERF